MAAASHGDMLGMGTDGMTDMSSATFDDTSSSSTG
jgi:hypothetical protein